MSHEEYIRKTAEQVVRALETPIAGLPSVAVRHRRNTVRLIAAALDVVHKFASQAERQDEQPVCGI